MTQKAQKKPAPKKQSALSGSTLWWILGGIVVIGLVAWLAVGIAGEEEPDPTIGFGSPVVEGTALPPYDSTAGDTATGTTAPTATGADWNGNPVTIEPDGTPKIVVFLAHWCPHCQAEAPVIQQWIDQGNLPSDVEMVSISTLANQLRGNWPPQDWLEDIGWTTPVIMDDQASTLATSYGLTSTPMFMVLDGDNVNLMRVSGELSTDALDELVRIAEQSIDG